MDVKDIPGVFPHIDLLWSEGAAYKTGFANALTTRAAAIMPGGFAVVSELSWLREVGATATQRPFGVYHFAWLRDCSRRRRGASSTVAVLAYEDLHRPSARYQYCRPQAGRDG